MIEWTQKFRFQASMHCWRSKLMKLPRLLWKFCQQIVDYWYSIIAWITGQKRWFVLCLQTGRVHILRGITEWCWQIFMTKFNTKTFPLTQVSFLKSVLPCVLRALPGTATSATIRPIYFPGSKLEAHMLFSSASLHLLHRISTAGAEFLLRKTFLALRNQ